MRHRQRRGTIYLITMGTAMIVSVLAMAALLAVRVQRRGVEDVADTARARLHARAALDMALFRIESDPDWREKLDAGTWEVDQPIGDGVYSFRAIDPVDGNLTDGVYDPVEIIATGQSGPARHILQVRLTVKQPGLRCLEPAIHAGLSLDFDDAVTATSDHFVSANEEIFARNGAQVHTDAEAAISVTAESGGVFHGSTTTEGDWPREMPDTGTVFDYYMDEGTEIDIEDLPFWDADHLINSDMSDGTTGWEPVGGCVLTSDADGSDSSNSIRVDGRDAVSDGPSQDVTDKIQSGETYYTKVDAKSLGGLLPPPIKPVAKIDALPLPLSLVGVLFLAKKEPIPIPIPLGGSLNLRITLTTESTGSGSQTVSTPWTEVGATEFVLVGGNLTPTWTGTLTEARWIVESQTVTTGFKVDAALLKIAGAEPDWHVIHRTVLSPASNPFGAGNTNSRGIYVVDCLSSEKVSVKDCRIVGTLVLLKQDKDSKIHGSMSWAPATVGPDPATPNLPALLTDKEITIAIVSTDLDEGQVNVNFNPAGTPHEGSEDSEKDDVYPSVIRGVVYCAKDILLENHPTFHGVVVGEKKITVNGTDLDVTHDPVYFEDNAPPGFRADPAVEIVSGSFRQVVE